ncbi:MAG: hypothetical protein EOM11_05335, partial [Erysipelotrichia bacterium]|nr:hypothetical protein [Erysipelotrichia bacterium]
FVLQWFALEALCATICPIFSSIVTAIGFRKKIVINTVIFAMIKLSINRLLIAYLGVPGMVLSSFIAYAVFSALNIYIIQKYYHVHWKYTFRKIIFMLVGIVGFYLVAQMFNLLGWIQYSDSRMISLLYLLVKGFTCCAVYFLITAFCNIPQSIFHFSIKSIVNQIKMRIRR